MDALTAKYRKILTQGMGKDVLIDILRECHFGCTLDATNVHQIAEYNVGVVILAKCGIFSKKTLEDVVNQLCLVSPVEEKTEKEEEE